MEAHEKQARAGGRADYSGFSLLSAESDVGAGGTRSGHELWDTERVQKYCSSVGNGAG